MPPPVAEPLATRIFLGPALRTQSDGRLVTLVREGYETAFEEIVRRYRRPLDRFAASFVGSRSEDVTQDAFSKALLALRGTTAEIELRPWLYRIVRNAALNDIRDRPPSVEQLAETLEGGQSAAAEAERREEMTELMERLRALPEPQRAAIVMRELEGLSHDEIAASLGVSGGAARQAIYRARATLRNSFGMLVPLPLLRMLFDHGAEAAAGGAAVGAAGAASTAAGAGLGGIGAGGAVKAGLATVLIAGSVGAAGVAIEHERSGHGGPDTAAAAVAPGASQSEGGDSGGSSGSDSGGGFETGDDHGAPGGAEPGDDRGGDRSSDHSGSGSSGHGSDSGPGSGDDDLSSGNGSDGGDSGHHSGRGSGSGSDDDSGHRGSDDSGSGNSGSGSSGSGHSGSGQSGLDDSVEDGGHHSGSGSSGSGDSGSGGGDDELVDDSSGPGSGGPAPLPPAEPVLDGDSSGSGEGSGSSGSGSVDG